MPDIDRRRALAWACGASLLTSPSLGRAAAPYPALDRPALQARMPHRCVLLSIAKAGTRLVAVGEHGIVVLSDDDGIHWRQAASVPTSVTLTAVNFVDARSGWAIGHGGVILRSDDGGERWVRQADGRTLASGADKPLLDLHFFDADRGFVIGAYNLCFETRDGGRSWMSAMDRLSNPKALHLYAIHADGDALHIVGEQGLMLRSLDGGRSFLRTPSPYAGSLFSLAVPKPQTLIAAGLRGNVFASQDRGASWASVAGAPPASIVATTIGADGALLFINQSGQLLVRRGDGPLQVLNLPPLPPLADLLALADGTLVAVGFSGVARLPAGAAR